MDHKISLHNIDIIITYRGSTPEREENLHATLAHFEYTYTDYRVLLIEADTQPKFDWVRLANPRILHYFQYDTGAFPKALLCNIGVKLSSSKIICIHDNDSIAEPHTLAGVINNQIVENVPRVICPFHNVINVTGEAKQAFMRKPDFAQFNGINSDNLLENYSLLYASAAGGINVWRREDYIRVGGMDAGFVGWGGEDNELLHRSAQLGIVWSSIIAPMFHLNHGNTNRSDFFNVDNAAQDNMQRAENIRINSSIEDIKNMAERLRRFFD